MESLKSKLDRLSPEERNQIEDYVDFLLSRSGQAGSPPASLSLSIPPALDTAPPPLPATGSAPAGETRPVRLQDLVRTGDQPAPAAGDGESPAPFHEIGGVEKDLVTHDYMDYGRFEHHTSPATEAVTKVKRKIIAREEQEKPRHLVDWVD